MLSDLNKVEMVLIMSPWVALYITWLFIAVDREERKTAARKENINGNRNQ